MSGALSNLAIAGEALLFSAPRQLGPYIADATFEEIGTDTLEVTRQPVQYGAAITDHAFKQPAQVTIRCGWSNSSPAATGFGLGLITNLVNPFGSAANSYVNDIYAGLLTLQSSAQPFVIITGKRVYQSMLFRQLRLTTDLASEYSLQIVAECYEVFLVQVTTTALPPASQQANPQSTGGVAQGPAQTTTQPPNQSLLLQGYNTVFGN